MPSLSAFAVENYRSVHSVVMPVSQLTLITGANGTGKSNLYRSLRLLAQAARGNIIGALAREGGLRSTMWAGPERVSRAMQQGEAPIQGTVRAAPVQLRLGFASDDFGYAIHLGLPVPSDSAFGLDPEIKREFIWSGAVNRTASQLLDRNGAAVRVRNGRQWDVAYQHLPPYESIFTHVANVQSTPEVISLREFIRSWRFYDDFRVDHDAPARQPQLGTRTTSMHHDGHDLAAAIQTIIEIGDVDALHTAVDDAFPGAKLQILTQADGRFTVALSQPGMLRPLTAAELSDGTLRFLLWCTALLTARPPPLMILNEPETSLHPDLLPALGRLIAAASEQSQIWVVSHSTRLAAALDDTPHLQHLALEKDAGRTQIVGQNRLERPAWRWA